MNHVAWTFVCGIAFAFWVWQALTRGGGAYAWMNVGVTIVTWVIGLTWVF